jgi:oxygen-independent coproporphyrinogen III oxidase
LELEADRYRDLGLEFDTLYIGGGTPSLLEPKAWAGILDSLKRKFSLHLDEFTLEANPSPFNNEGELNSRDKGEPGVSPVEIGAEWISGWVAAGVTRLSIGVQSFDDGVLDILGRESSASRASDFVRLARRAGFASVGLDLMAGVPGETPSGLAKTLDEVRRLAPDHVSLYILENVEGLPFEDVLRANPVEDDATADAFEFLATGLETAGLRRYEISNFARPGHECRHNLKYWRYEPFLGLGPSAGSHIGAGRWLNVPDLDGWAATLSAGGDPRVEIVTLTPDAAAKEALISGLRLTRGVDAEEYGERFGIDLFARYGNEIEALADDGFLIRDGRTLRIPEDRLLVSNAILSRFV